MMELRHRCGRFTHYFETGSFEVPLQSGELNSEWVLVCQYVESLGFSPAVAPVASAIIYDTLAQHGNGSDKDSLGAIIKSTGPRPAWNEAVWLERFLSARFKVLFHPNDRTRAAKWRQSAPRVNALRLLLQKHPQMCFDEGYESAISNAF